MQSAPPHVPKNSWTPSSSTPARASRPTGRLRSAVASNRMRWLNLEKYTVSHRECGQFRPYVHENFEKFKIISTPTGSWIRSRGAIESNCPSGSKLSWIFQNFYEHRDGIIHTLDGTQYRNTDRLIKNFDGLLEIVGKVIKAKIGSIGCQSSFTKSINHHMPPERVVVDF